MTADDASSRINLGVTLQGWHEYVVLSVKPPAKVNRAWPCSLDVNTSIPLVQVLQLTEEPASNLKLIDIVVEANRRPPPCMPNTVAEAKAMLEDYARNPPETYSYINMPVNAADSAIGKPS